jgi:hypothetical protein
MRRVVFALAGPLALVACTHDFGAFDPVAADEGGGADTGTPEGSTADHVSHDVAMVEGSPDGSADVVPDGPCMATACLDTAMTCGQTCEQDRKTCDASCHGSFHCMQMCRQTAMTCNEDCITTCVSCAESDDCPSQAACQAAAPEGGA